MPKLNQQKAVDLETIAKEADAALVQHCVAGTEGFYLASDGSSNSAERNFRRLFGRDALLVSWFRLKRAKVLGDFSELHNIDATLFKLANTQGRMINPENGEFPGKILHEISFPGEQPALRDPNRNWYTDENDFLYSYMSADSTPLFAVVCYERWALTLDDQFLQEILPYVKGALLFLMRHGNINKDGLQSYRFEPTYHGGLKNHGWMDSSDPYVDVPQYPVALVEVQAYTYTAYSLWLRHFEKHDRQFASWLADAKNVLKKRFHRAFGYKDGKNGWYLGTIFDRDRKLTKIVRSNPGHVLCFSGSISENDPDGLLTYQQAKIVCNRLMQDDMFEPAGGIRTLSSEHKSFDPLGYQRGSIWPHDSELCAEGFVRYGFESEAKKVREALIHASRYFDSPGMELYLVDKQSKELSEWIAPEGGQMGNRRQSWSLAANSNAASWLASKLNSKIVTIAS